MLDSLKMEQEDPISSLEAHIKSNQLKDAVVTIEKHLQEFLSCPKHVFSDTTEELIAKLFYAAIDNDCENALTVLIHHGCDVDCGITARFRSYPRSPLYHAAKCGNLSAVQILLDAGCKRNNLNNTGSTALYEAVFEGHIEIVKLLLANGCDPNIPDCYGKTLMHIFPFSSGTTELKTKCMELLLEYGADLSVKCTGNQTPVDLAIQYKYVLTMRCLMKNSQRFKIRRIPHSPSVLGDRILPELLLTGPFTEGSHLMGTLLLQLHPCHQVEHHTLEEFIRVCRIEPLPGMDFHAEARRFYRLLILSGVENIPTKELFSLQDLCRQTIRRQLKEECWYRCRHLPVPTGIQDYLQLCDIIKDDPLIEQ